jgi:UV DNA damage endonuclease
MDVLRHLGFVSNALAIDAAPSRTCRLKGASPERLRALIGINLGELEKILHYCDENRVHLYRISSEVVPFASHPVNTLRWWEEFAGTFERLGALIRRMEIRVTMHPGQFTVLNSTNPKVVAASIEEVGWHVRFLDALGTGRSSKVVLHVGGGFGDKPAALARFASVVADLPESYRARIVVENDERVYSVEDVLEVSARTGLPMIFDNLHDAVHSGRLDGASRYLADVFATWKVEDGPPKMHISTQAEGGRPGAHAEFIGPDDLIRVLEAAPAGRPFDAMLEAKQKDRALLRLREELRARGVSEAGAITSPELPPLRRSSRRRAPTPS